MDPRRERGGQAGSIKGVLRIMRLIFGGVRGSRPITDPDFSSYGGDTTAVLVEGSAGELVVIDAGSGVANLESFLGPPGKPLLMVFSHFHLDHLLGFPSFGPLGQENRSIALVGPRGLDRALEGLVGPPYWPLRLDEAPADLQYPDPSARALSLGNLDIRFCPTAHPGGSLAYRIDERSSGAGLVFATDMEWAAMGGPLRDIFLDMCSQPAPPQLLVMDGFLHPQDTMDAAGWGHSSFFEAVEVARRIGAAQLIVTHHHPEHDDAALDALEGELQAHLETLGAQITGAFARQGQVIELGE